MLAIYVLRRPAHPLVHYRNELFSDFTAPFVVKCRIGCFPIVNYSHRNLWMLESNFLVSSLHVYCTMTNKTWTRIMSAHNPVYDCEPKYFSLVVPGRMIIRRLHSFCHLHNLPSEMLYVEKLSGIPRPGTVILHGWFTWRICLQYHSR